MKNTAIILLLGAFFINATLPIETNKNPEDLWKTLGKVTFKMEKDDFMDYDVEVPIFSKEVRALAGKREFLVGVRAEICLVKVVEHFYIE